MIDDKTTHNRPERADPDELTLIPFATGRQLFAAILVGAQALLAAGCATTPPTRQGNICHVFEQYPDWYDYARMSAKRWGTPVHVQMSFVRHESSYRSDAKPPRRWFLFIPLGRPSSAKGYAQAQDPVWGEYQAERGRLFRGRGDMEDALDFIGWYNHNRDRGKPCGSTPPTPPCIRVRTRRFDGFKRPGGIRQKQGRAGRRRR